MENVILCEVADGIATVTLNRPQAMNALNRALRKRLAEVMRAVDADASVRAVILTGAGERAFTAGLDLKELGSEEGALGSATEAMQQARELLVAAGNGSYTDAERANLGARIRGLRLGHGVWDVVFRRTAA